MNPLYNLAVGAYRLGVKAAALRPGKARRLVEGHRLIEPCLKERVASPRPEGERWVWIHAASLGEFEQGRPLIDLIKRERPGWKVLLTFFSPSGYEVRRNYAGADAVSYLPFDTPGAVRRFLDLARPDMAVFVKYEFWGNYLTELSRRGVPTYIISAIFRPGQIFFRPWGGMMRRVLRCFTRLYVQDEASRGLLAGIGIDNVVVAGDTRFDRVTDILRDAPALPAAIDRFAQGCRDLLVAGSTWEPDEDIIIPWLEANRGVKAIFAPHEFDPARLARLRSRLGSGTFLLSELTAPGAPDAAGARHIIVDSFGLLASVYRKATLAYVGGGFGAGIHNLNEAAVYGLPVIFGPRHGKFKEARDLIDCGGGFSIASADEFNRAASALTGPDSSSRARAGKAAGLYISRSVGATGRIFQEILPNTNPI